jgi:hypothetical protein
MDKMKLINVLIFSTIVSKKDTRIIKKYERILCWQKNRQDRNS